MLVSEILADVRPAYCETWDKVFEYFKTTPHEWRRVEELMKEITERGLSEPGRIDFHESFEGDDAFLPAPEEYFYLGNGTHRFAAHYFLGLEDFPVTYEEEKEDISKFYEMTEVEMWIKKEFVPEEKFGDDAFFDCFASSLSFRVNDELWVESGGASSHPVGPGISYNMSFTVVPYEAQEAFMAKFLERIACCVKPEMIDYLSVGRITHYEEPYWTPEEK